MNNKENCPFCGKPYPTKYYSGSCETYLGQCDCEQTKTVQGLQNALAPYLAHVKNVERAEELREQIDRAERTIRMAQHELNSITQRVETFRENNE